MRRWALALAVCLGAYAVLVWTCPSLEVRGYGQWVRDRHGQLLRITLAEDQRYRLKVPLTEISQHLIDATLAYEDAYFFQHPGLNPVSLGKAVYGRLFSVGRRRGASTLTMQVARLRFGLNTTTPAGKAVQIFRALQLEAAYSKEEILEAYFHLAPYGGNIEGAEAASQVYFHKSAKDVSWPEAMALATIPQNPTKRNLLSGEEPPPLQAARQRLARVLVETKNLSPEVLALEVPLKAYRLSELPFLAPHAVEKALAMVPKDIATVSLTLDARMQQQWEKKIRGYVEQMGVQGVENAVAMLVDTETAEVLVRVGSAGFHDDSILGQVDGTQASRSPGSALKPFVNARALDEGLIHPQSLLHDVPMRFGQYNPENFDSQYVGPLSAKDALVRSRNVPAIDLNMKLKTGLYEMLQTVGTRGLREKTHYGAGIVLGAVEVSMEEVLQLYTALSREGEWVPLRWRLEDSPTDGRRLMSREAARLTLDMLKSPASNADRWLSALELADVSWKTGTSHAFRDAWTVGVVGKYAVAVWVGNFDGTPNAAFVGRSAAAPLFFSLVESLRSSSKNSTPRKPLLDLLSVDVCAVSGKLPGPHCSRKTKTQLIAGVSPISRCDVHRVFHVDVETGKAECSPTLGKTRDEVYEVWPSDVLQLFQQAGFPRKAIPQKQRPCHGDEASVTKAPFIVSPQNDMRVVLRRGHPSESKLLLLANADGAAHALTWFAGKELIGSVTPGRILEWAPPAGAYELRVVDNLGKAATVLTHIEWVDEK